MKKILICAQKGGVGKSLIADELAFSFERTGTQLAFYDLDRQGGTLHPTVQNENAEVTVIDTPGALQTDVAEWIKAADLVIIPTRASTRDIPPFQRMIAAVDKNQSKNCRTLYVINAFNRYTASRDFLTWLKNMRQSGQPPFTKRGSADDICFLPQAEAFVQAAAANQSVVAFAHGSPAAKATMDFCNLVRTVIGMEREDGQT